MTGKNIAIITARGGSKRIPRKNIKEFCGRPILCYSIEAALTSCCFDTVMVSTDDEEIAEIARKAGAEVPFLRSEANANDYATTADVLKEVLDAYEAIGEQFDYACCIYPTAPFVTGEKLKEAMETLRAGDVTCVMPVVAYSFPPQRAVVIRDGYLKVQYPEFFQMRSQDLEKIYHDVGQFYAFEVNAFRQTGKIIGERTMPVVVSETRVQDIDTPEDWKIAEMKYRLMREGGTR